MKVNIFLVSCDENGQRVETPWAQLPESRRCEWYESALDRAMDAMGYVRADCVGADKEDKKSLRYDANITEATAAAPCAGAAYAKETNTGIIP